MAEQTFVPLLLAVAPKQRVILENPMQMLGAPAEVWNTLGDKVINQAGELVRQSHFVYADWVVGDQDNDVSELLWNVSASLESW